MSEMRNFPGGASLSEMLNSLVPLPRPHRSPEQEGRLKNHALEQKAYVEHLAKVAAETVTNRFL